MRDEPDTVEPTAAFVALLRDGNMPAPRSAHEQVAALVDACSPAAEVGAGRFVYLTSDPFGWVLRVAIERAGRAIGPGATWLRVVEPQTGRGLVAVLQCSHPDGEAELLLMADPGMFTRSTIRALCRWAFCVIGLQRVSARIPADDAVLADLLHRGGFAHEGRLRDAHGPGRDAALWAMTTARCPWLPRPASVIPTADASPPSSLRVH